MTRRSPAGFPHAFVRRWGAPHLTTGVLALALTLLASGPAAAQTGNTSIYWLTDRSTYQSGCFGPCACAVMTAAPVIGTFKLAPKGSDPLFTYYDVTDVSWTVWLDGSDLQITGAGTYKRGGEVALQQQLTLDLSVGGELQHFDSGLVPANPDFPAIDITISVNYLTCLDRVIHVSAKPAPPPGPLPRHAQFVVEPSNSTVELILFYGTMRSKLAGAIQLCLGDPAVSVPAIAGLVGLSVDGAELVALDPTNTAVPLIMKQDPKVHSIGSWNTLTGQIAYDLHLIATSGSLPVPQPVHLKGVLLGGTMRVRGNNGNIPDGTMRLQIEAFEAALPPPASDLWFSTNTGFTSAGLLPDATGTLRWVSDGDLLSRRGYIVRTNNELTRRLGIMPPAPDLGLDAVMLGRNSEIWFSFKQSAGPIWSETLKCWLKPGDLLSEAGYVVQTNEQLLARFVRMPPVSDVGLDAITRSPTGELLFSTDQDFFCESLGQTIHHGDLLSSRGRVVMTNAQLLANFQFMGMGPVLLDYGLDAVVMLPNGEFWFSTEVGFVDARFGAISDGDLLSTRGYVVARNRDLLAAFKPVEDLNNFGLDAASAMVPCAIGDFSGKGYADLSDIDAFLSAVSAPAVASPTPELGDLDGDGDVDMDDFGLLQRCMTGPGVMPDPDCAN